MKSKKRRSLQSLFIPFAHTPITSPLQSPSGSRYPSSPTSPVFQEPPVLGSFLQPPSLSVLTGEKLGRQRAHSHSSINGRNSKVLQAAMNVFVRASHLGGPEEGSTSDTINTPDAIALGAREATDASTSANAHQSMSIPSTPGISHSVTPISSRSESPSSFLLDDDPFANLSPVAVEPKSRPSTSSGSSSIVPASERPKPVHPELMIPPVLTHHTKSRLQDKIVEEDEGDAGSVDQEMMERGRRKDRQDDDGSRKKKSYLSAMSAPTSPSRGFFSSRPSADSMPPPPLPPMPGMNQPLLIVYNIPMFLQLALHQNQ